ncbi:hypothetical protein K492DRAFT_162717 [Lichtheimia hyalospora FSU 10163]|nr:hypothetical protein K492DRAFT_162717 [Lichtheimia hyalospora FSU 10163]
MVSDMNDIPAAYFQHCADKEPYRLELSIDRSKVRLPREDDGTLDNQETDPYGYLSTTSDDDNHATPISNDNHRNATLSDRFQPYSPMFSTGKSVLPVYFKNGKFYSDSEPDKEPHLDRPAMDVPPYDKLKIEPLGDDNGSSSKGGSVCFNCGDPDHALRDCPQPRDEQMIRERRKNMKAPPSMGRFFVELELRNKIVHCAPGQLSTALQDALGMNGLHPDPPYYAKMREHGYPPGYWGKPSSSQEVKQTTKGWLNDMLYRDAPDIKIYSDDSSYQATNSQSHEDDTLSNKVKLVYYPGLYDSSSKEQHQQMYQESHIHYTDYSYQSQPYTTQPTYYDSYYHYYHAQQYYHPPPPATQYDYPGTMSTTMPYVDMEQHVATTTSALITNAPPPPPLSAAVPESDDDMDISDGE